MTPKDGLGNELREGQLVQVMLDSRNLRGRVRSIRSGGVALAAPGQNAPMTPGVIMIVAEIYVPVNPMNPQAMNVVRLVDPDESKQPRLDA